MSPNFTKMFLNPTKDGNVSKTTLKTMTVPAIVKKKSYSTATKINVRQTGHQIRIQNGQRDKDRQGYYRVNINLAVISLRTSRRCLVLLT